MPYATLIVAPQSQALSVTAATRNGATITLYSDVALASAVTLPNQISSSTTYYVDTMGTSGIGVLVTVEWRSGVTQTFSVNLAPGVSSTISPVLTQAQIGAYDKAQPKVAKIPITVVTAGAKDTGFDLPTKGLVLDVWVDVLTKEDTQATKTIDVGLLNSESSGDADGFLAAVSVATAGVVRGLPTITVGGTETYFASTTRGAYLATILAGANVAGDVGTYFEKPHILNGTNVSLGYTMGGAMTEFVGTIYVMYVDLS